MPQTEFRRIQVIDSHTGGEPTRVVVAGGPDLGRGTMAERLAVFRERHDDFRSCVVNEPRGSDVVVGALLCEPTSPEAAAGVIFFNNIGYLGMCGHGTIGLGATLAHLGRIGPGVHRVETPVGDVTMELEADGSVAVENVVSRRAAKGVAVDVPGLRPYVGDVAWGGNWFFLVDDHGERIDAGNVERLTDVSWRIRQALAAHDVRGDDGGEIDHVELFGPPSSAAADGRNFVLCPGKAYDRSPCGTGTSAKLACLVADGKLAEGRAWRQESVVGSVFEGSARIVEGGVRPRIRGTAYITAESTLLVDRRDPFGSGIRS
ncbi:4-hydroxyproline epimerase [Paludisphaera soli]|uniref:4-hydroxyproline epimerase n=1 Tax=Paludisphaera soli TaxID=2712865 RepID=UPI0013ED5B17|nr:4-hydroxyproline epimerase [Paludisphaera soli]